MRNGQIIELLPAYLTKTISRFMLIITNLLHLHLCHMIAFFHLTVGQSSLSSAVPITGFVNVHRVNGPGTHETHENPRLGESFRKNLAPYIGKFSALHAEFGNKLG